MPFELKMTSEQAIEKLKNLYGTEITTADIKAFCAMNDITYQTVTKKLSNFKVAKGKWNLEVTSAAVENIEKSYNSPAVLPASVEDPVDPEPIDLTSLSKDELEDYGRTIGIELDRRHSKSKLVKELEDHIEYLKTV